MKKTKEQWIEELVAAREEIKRLDDLGEDFAPATSAYCRLKEQMADQFRGRRPERRAIMAAVRKERG